MEGNVRGRRAVLAALGACALAGAAPALAQDPRLSAAQAAALQWLARVDASDAAGTYSGAAQRFRSAMTQEQWAASLASAHDQFGAMVRRTLTLSRAGDDIPGKPEGEFAMFVYRAEFTKRDVMMETVTLEREADGVWRVVGYSMR